MSKLVLSAEPGGLLRHHDRGRRGGLRLQQRRQIRQDRSARHPGPEHLRPGAPKGRQEAPDVPLEEEEQAAGEGGEERGAAGPLLPDAREGVQAVLPLSTSHRGRLQALQHHGPLPARR